RIAVEREIGQPYSAQKFQPLYHLAANALRNQRLTFAELQIDGSRQGAIQRKGSEVGDRKSAHLYSQRLRPQALAAARWARRGRHITHHVFAITIAPRFV